MKIEEWNTIPKDSETDSIAIDGDLVTEIDGIAFLVQRKNNFNNTKNKVLTKINLSTL